MPIPRTISRTVALLSPRISVSAFLAFAVLFVFSASAALAAKLPLAPTDQWKLTGTGKQVEPGVLEVSGDGKSTSRWDSPPIPLIPGKHYRFSVEIFGVDSNAGCLPCGIGPIHRDFRSEKGKWVRQEYIFRLPSPRGLPSQDEPQAVKHAFRVGQWNSTGAYRFRNMSVEPVETIYRETVLPSAEKNDAKVPKTLLLGEGESVRGGVYRFDGNFGGIGSNSHRPLVLSTASFNSNRWCLGANTEIVYRLELAPYLADTVSGPGSLALDKVGLRVTACYHSAGEGVVEISRDGKTGWTELGRIDKVGSCEHSLPETAGPVESLYLRVRGLDGSNFQVDGIHFEAKLSGSGLGADSVELSGVGQTLFAVCENPQTGENLALDALKAHRLSLTPDGRFRIRNTASLSSKPRDIFHPLAGSATLGEHEERIKTDDASYTFKHRTHPFDRSDYGTLLPKIAGKTADCTLWWCEADWKVSRDRQPPAVTEPLTATQAFPTVSAAKNDYESFQLVLRTSKPLKGLTGKVGALTGPGGATIPPENIELRYAYYHFVQMPTDSTGKIGYWPDALPSLDRPLDVPADTNQPIWITVKVPENATAGNYGGTFRLETADGTFKAEIPYTVEVWDFALPRHNHLQTAFGFNPGNAARYHNAKTEEDRRRVSDLYLQCFADHRISVYRPFTLDDYSVRWLTKEDPPRCEIDFTRFDAEMTRVLEKFPFTHFRLSVHGLGGGTFHNRIVPKIGGFEEGTPEYDILLKDYLGKLQAHLKERGWLDKAYVYWFDEPDQKDYDYVAAGFAKLSKYAPELPRMITEEPNEGFLAALEKAGTSIDIWCPVSHNYDPDAAKPLMEKGARFWWYVCTGPKAPYCTLFIDHPATELRVWHWQAWKRNIVGTLVWESTYWTSSAAFPGTPQDPYLDPMGYVSGYSMAPGTKRNWGNGDGRFLYPPLAASQPGKNEGKPIFEKPVSSIRWEMIREGVEDYEMLYRLRELLGEKGDRIPAERRKACERLLEVPETISVSMTEFTIDPRPLLQRRREVAKAVEDLTLLK